MDLGLKDKNVIVTGGASNIGRTICLGFGGEGAHVTVVDMDDENGNKVVQMIQDQGSKAKFIQADVTKYEDAERVVKESLEEFGQIDGLVNNVGWDDFVPFLKIPVENYDRYLDLNLRHVLYFTRAVLPQMMAAKGGVISFTKNTAREFGRFQIRANCVCPGATMPKSDEETGKFSLFRQEEVKTLFPPEVQEKLAKHGYPLRRLGKAEDIANMVIFIASSRASWITGQTISVSGGYSMF
ncbi:MAG: SDR family oxidoreductase [Deltaproteobacteria bacterium]|nr:SDR family oxidoreductase [Deltaproteobacteria bacterium]